MKSKAFERSLACASNVPNAGSPIVVSINFTTELMLYIVWSTKACLA